MERAAALGRARLVADQRVHADAFLEGAQRVGTVLILALMAYVIVIKQVLKLF